MSATNETQLDAVIVGAGPAGLTAALYLARAGIETTVIERVPLGGTAAVLTRIANYPGVPDTTGFDLVGAMAEQARSFGARFVDGTVEKIDSDGSVRLTRGDVFRPKAVLFAGGVGPKPLGLAREAELIGRGVSYCATCDGNFFKGMPVAVAGNGGRAAGAARYLLGLASKVYFVSEDTEAPEGAECIAGKVTELVGTPLSAIKATSGGKELTLGVSALFVSAGSVPLTGPVRELVKTDADGYIEVNADFSTSVPWLFAAGDVVVKKVRQIVTAAADGAVAASAIAEYIRKKR